MSRQSLLICAARFGYAARGLVYVMTGAVAVLASIERLPRSTGTAGALATLGHWPLGRLWLITVAVGLICFAGWRAIEALFDPDRRGHDRDGLVARAGKGVDAVVHAGLALTALQLLGALQRLNEDAAARRETAEILAAPHGQWLLWAVAAGVLAGGLSNGWRALNADFRDGVICPPRLHRLVEWSGRFGHLALGLVLALLAMFLATAAYDQDPSAAKSIGGTLQALEAQPFGSSVMAALGFGFVLFGLYALLEARFRCLRAPEALT